MSTIDLTPFYRNSIGFDRIASLINNAMMQDNAAQGYPPYNIEVVDENNYAITLAVAGFTLDELNIVSEKGVLTVKGVKADKQKKQYLHQGIANRNFERKFNLADHVEVVDADLQNGMLTINLVRIIPEAMKPKIIAIKSRASAVNQLEDKQQSAS
ncbi:MAG: Hsp20 family protein [Pseudomonadota bacterium]|nr:Hsp20 family protein [Pseudomonadota bacterium]